MKNCFVKNIFIKRLSPDEKKITEAQMAKNLICP
jgi:hypothetical protein